jgi:hypothetical protein
MQTCQNPDKQSNVKKYLEPKSVKVVSLNFGKGYGSNFVTEFKARKSTQNLNLGLPSGLSFGTRLAAANQDKLLSIMTTLSSIC